MTGRHVASRSPQIDPLWFVVGGGAALVRIVLGLSVGLTPYSGDSWCLLNLGDAPLCASHPPTITWFWRLLTLGTFTQGSVLLVQGVLGVGAALILFGILRRVADHRLAAAGALVASLMPVSLFMERAIMTEFLETFLVLVGLGVGLTALRARRRIAALWQTGAAVLAFGVAAAIHSAIVMTSVGLSVLLVVLVVWRQLLGRTRGSVATLVLLPFMAGIVLVAPSIPMAVRYHSTFGVWSSQAMGGTYLAASWAPLLDCPAPSGSAPAVDAFYAVACQHHSFGSPPGVVTKLMWAPSLGFLRTAPAPAQRADFAAAQSTLGAAALSGILHHPGTFSAEVSRSLWFQLAGRATTRALHVYNTGRPRWEAAQRGAGVTASAVRSWFGSAVPGVGQPRPSLSAAVRTTDRVPQILLWLTALAGIARLVHAAGRRRRDGRSLELAGWWRRPPSDRVSLGLLASVVLATCLLSWAIGSWSIFRLWAPMVPAVAILAVLVVPQRHDERPTSETAVSAEALSR